MNGTRRRARTIPFFLTRGDIERLYVGQGGKCAISGVDMTCDRTPLVGDRRWANASVDRINSNGSYELGNVHLVTIAINTMKNMMTLEELGYWCKAVVMHNLEKSA